MSRNRGPGQFNDGTEEQQQQQQQQARLAAAATGHRPSITQLQSSAAAAAASAVPGGSYFASRHSAAHAQQQHQQQMEQRIEQQTQFIMAQAQARIQAQAQAQAAANMHASAYNTSTTNSSGGGQPLSKKPRPNDDAPTNNNAATTAAAAAAAASPSSSNNPQNASRGINNNNPGRGAGATGPVGGAAGGQGPGPFIMGGGAAGRGSFLPPPIMSAGGIVVGGGPGRFVGGGAAGMFGSPSHQHPPPGYLQGMMNPMTNTHAHLHPHAHLNPQPQPPTSIQPPSAKPQHQQQQHQQHLSRNPQSQSNSNPSTTNTTSITNTTNTTSTTSISSPIHSSYNNNPPSNDDDNSNSGRGIGSGGNANKGKGKGGKGKGGKNKNANQIKHIIFSNGRPEMPPPRWYDACVPLGVEDDKFWLSELHCILRRDFIEAFGTTQTDIVLPVHGRNKPIALGQVGLRCMHCKNLPSIDRPNHAITYPNFISGIYNAVQQMFRQHFDCCPRIPLELKGRIRHLRDASGTNRGGRKQYWMDSAKRVGLVDTPWGIHFGRDPTEPLPPWGGSATRSGSASSLGLNEGYLEEDAEEDGGTTTVPAVGSGDMEEGGEDATFFGGGSDGDVEIQEPEPYPLVEPEDRPLINDYLYLALEQMQPCNLMDADRVGCYKGRKLGFPGLACKHCVGQAGCGRYFPASEGSISQTTTSQTIVNHVRNCRRCPIEIREQLELMKRAKAGPESKKGDKPKHGGRKVFFHRLWCRIQRIPIPKLKKQIDPDQDDSVTESPKKEVYYDDDQAEAAGNEYNDTSGCLSDDENASQHEFAQPQFESEVNGVDERGLGMETINHNAHKPEPKPGQEYEVENENDVEELEDETVSVIGKTRLSREDDPHWLSDAQCFIRQELVEVFTANDEDIAMTGASENGQVGIRCVYCAKSRALEERQNGHVFYPSSISQIQQAVSDLTRRHFQLCSAIPDDIRETFKSMKGYGAKTEDDTSQYWIDSAGELGLCDSFEGQGVRFFRNPAYNSPAEDLEADKSSNKPTNSFIVRPEDRTDCTDHLILLMQQFVPCRFEETDRKGGQSSRGRDRPIGFPGLACMHCHKKRYFPIAAKNFSDTHNLMVTHVGNCFSVPLPIKASLKYLQHRSILQKAELASNYKLCFFKRIWDRLHNEEWPNEGNTKESDSKPAVIEESQEQSAAEESDESFEEEDQEESPEVNETSGGDSRQMRTLAAAAAVVEEAPENHDHLEEMRGLIKAAALWLCERDAELDRRTRAGRGRGTIQTTTRLVGRGRGGRGGRGRGGR